MIKYTFIVPIYNAEQTITKCIESILRQKNIDYEIILVNDGSTDNSLKICENYSKTYENIIVINKTNCGQAAARNDGIDIAKGKYIMFCDADDCYDSFELENVMNSVTDVLDDDNLICFDFKNMWEGIPEKNGKYCPIISQQLTCQERIHAVSSERLHKISGYAVWNKIYSKKILDQYSIRFPEKGRIGNADDWAEDLAFNIQYYLHVKEICVLPHSAYLLTKHGKPCEQNEKCLINRISHMMNILESVYSSKAILVSDIYKQSFGVIAMWHLRRYIYLTLREYGIKWLRKNYLQNSHEVLFSSWIKEFLHDSVKNNNQKNEESVNEEYLIILKYLLTGRYWQYKVEIAFLWKIKNRLRKVK